MIRSAALVLLAVAAAGCVTNPDERVIDIRLRDDAEREFALEQYLAAAGHYEAFLAENPQLKDSDRAKIHMMAGRAYLGAGRVEQAVLTFDQALGESPSPSIRWDILFRRAVAYRMKGEISRALDGFRSVATAPGGERGTSVTADELHYENALALFRSGDWKGGQAEIAMVSAKGPFAKQARMRMGLTSFTVQVGAYSDDVRARAEAEKVKGTVRVIPGDRPLYAVTFGSFARYEEAQREADRLRRQYPDAFVLP